MSVRRVVSLAIAVLVAAAGSGIAAAQQPAQRPAASAQRTRCELTSARFSTDTIPGGQQVQFAGGNVIIRCPGRGIVIQGDSAERRPDGDHMIGHSIYDDPRLHVTADFLNYFQPVERVVAVGNVKGRLPSGSTMTGPLAEWLRVMPTRPREEMFARMRPTIKLVQTDTTKPKPGAKPQPPDTTTVLADLVHTLGDSLIYASGQVVITRTDITATGDSAFMDQGKETMRLMRGPTLLGKKERPFTLKGDLIDMFSKNRKLERVIARAHAVATSDSMTLKSDTIDLRVRNELLDHAFAWGRLSRARATSPTQNLLADSLDVTMPNQKVRLMRAVGHAFAEGKPDTVRFIVEKPDTVDWLRGDTITAHFDTLATKDTSKTPNIRQLFAMGSASSWYHIPPSDSAERRAAINQVSAHRITIDFDKQKVAVVTAVDSVVGVYVEPRADSTTKKTNAANVAGKAPAKTGSQATPATQKPAPKPPPKPTTSSSAPLKSTSPTQP